MFAPRRSRQRDANQDWPGIRDRYRVGETALGVGPICVGIVDDPRVIPAAFDAGVNFFFLTADMHWPLYQNTRRGLEMLFSRGRSVRDNVVVGVVSYVAQPEFCRLPFIEVLEAVAGLKHVDMSIIGGAYAHDFFVRLTQYKLHRQGSVPGVQATGASFHDRPACASALNHHLVDIGFVRYNPIHPGAEHDLFPHLTPATHSLIYNFRSTKGFMSEDEFASLGLARDDWRPHLTDYYRFALSRPEVDGLLCKLATTAHVAELAAALERGPLDAEELQYIRDLGDLRTGRAKVERT